MTDQEINTAIAEACGWQRKTKKFGTFWYQPGPCDTGHLAPPNYCHDLNAMHEAEETLPITNYYEQLYVADKTGIMVGYRHLWHATARQRAEAFLRVKGLWKD